MPPRSCRFRYTKDLDFHLSRPWAADVHVSSPMAVLFPRSLEMQRRSSMFAIQKEWQMPSLAFLGILLIAKNFGSAGCGGLPGFHMLPQPGKRCVFIVKWPVSLAEPVHYPVGRRLGLVDPFACTSSAGARRRWNRCSPLL